MARCMKNYVRMVLIVSVLVLSSTVAKAYTVDRKVKDTKKDWKIEFNKEVDLDNETRNDIKVRDSKGNLINISVDLENNDVLKVNSPKEGYKKGEIYTLTIGDKVHSKGLKYLKSPKTFTFEVSSDEGNKETVDKHSKEKEELNSKYKNVVNKTIDEVAEGIEKKGIETEWEAIGLKKCGKDVPENYIDKVKNELVDNKGILDQPTDYQKLVLCLDILGKDPTNFGGYNLLEKVYNDENIESQGINAYIFALKVLGLDKYDIPNNALWNKEKLIKVILDKKTEDNGWDYVGMKADPDMTSMAISALKSYSNRKDVKKVIDDAIETLSKIQKPNGNFSSYRVENCESVCQVITSLCENGINPTSKEFTKNGVNCIDSLMTFKTKDGGFSHEQNGNKSVKATEQAVQALLAFKEKFLN